MLNSTSASMEVDLFLFMGQSNMAGRGITNETWPEQAPSVIKGAGYEYRAVSAPSELYPITEPFGVNENRPDGINDGDMKTGSMVSAFVNSYFEQTNVPIVGVSASKGGSWIDQWQPGGAFLSDTIQRYVSCIDYLEHNGYTIRHKYVLWCQGETDGSLNTDSDIYTSKFNTMLEALKQNGIEKLFLVRIGHYNGADNKDYTRIIKLQNTIAQTNEDVVMVATNLAGMKERGLMKDDFHYYQQAYNETGKYAGVNAAFYVKNGKEPTMFDTLDHTLYFSHKN